MSIFMSDERVEIVATQKDIQQVKREAAVSLIASLARAMGAQVVYYNPEFGEFALRMDPSVVDFFEIESVVSALGGVS